MKSIQFLFFLATFFAFQRVQAQGARVNGKITQISSNEVNVLLVKARDEKAKIKVRSERGKVLYQQKIKKHNRATIDYIISDSPKGYTRLKSAQVTK